MAKFSSVPLSIMTGQDYKIERIGDRDYKVTALSLSDLGKLEQWVKAQFPDPIETGKRAAEGMPLEIAREIMAKAVEQANNPKWCLGTEAATQLLMSLPGVTEMLSLQLAKYHPELTRDQVSELVQLLYERADAEQTAEGLYAKALAHEPDIVEEAFGPKATTGTDAPTRKRSRGVRSSTSSASSRNSRSTR